jgi:cob(I)alamin adenosyltransferase
MKKGNGMVQVFTGEGRGKTSAALGTVMRAAGYGLKVFVVFFMKGHHELGEYASLQKLGVNFKVMGRPDFLGPADIQDKDRELARQALDAATTALVSGKYDLIVLDEVNTAAAWKLIGVGDVLRLINARPQGIELILTGRYADDLILARADYVTELINLKHPFDRGVPAREGIDY